MIRKFITAGMLCAALTVSPAAAQTTSMVPPQQFGDLGDFKLASGQTIQACKLGYRTMGRLNAAKSNAILVPTAFNMQSDVAAGLVTGQQRLFDPAPYFVIFVDTMGDGISCSPSTSTSQHGAAFPHFTMEDMVASEHALVTRVLGISHLHAVIGVSMAGMQTFQWAVQYPGFMDEAIPIVGSPRPTSYDLLFYSTQKAALPNLAAASLILNMNVFTPKYRVDHTSRSQFETFFQAASASDASFDSDDWGAQDDAMIGLDVAHGGSMSAAAARVRARMLIVTSMQDHAVNPAPALAFAPLVHAQVLALQGDCGHLAFVCESDKIEPAVDAFLRGGT